MASLSQCLYTAFEISRRPVGPHSEVWSTSRACVRWHAYHLIIPNREPPHVEKSTVQNPKVDGLERDEDGAAP